MAVAWTLLPGATPAQAQGTAAPAAPVDTASLHASLSSWGDRTWLLLADRRAAETELADGQGLLLRFHPDFDGEIVLDHLSSPFTPLDDHAWRRRENGVRYWTGSINHLVMTDGLDAKVRIPVTGAWSFGLRYTRETNPALARELVRPEVSWTGGGGNGGASGYRAYLGASLQPRKPDRDVYAGVAWSGDRGRWDASVHALDAFNDFIFGGLGVDRAFTTETVSYGERPWGLRLSGEARLAAGTRLEVEGGLLLRGRFRVTEVEDPSLGFRQEDGFEQLGLLLEQRVGAAVRAGFVATHVEALQDRTPLEGIPGGSGHRFELRERTLRAGAFLLADVAPRLRAQAWGGREWRKENRDGTADPEDAVDYLDRSWWGMLQVDYRLGRIYNGAVAWEMDFRDVVRGSGQVPSLDSLDQDNQRLRFDFGWRVAERFRLEAGFRLDTDGDPRYDRSRFDGGHGRVVLHW